MRKILFFGDIHHTDAASMFLCDPRQYAANVPTRVPPTQAQLVFSDLEPYAFNLFLIGLTLGTALSFTTLYTGCCPIISEPYLS
jgi:hypothetical protein